MKYPLYVFLCLTIFVACYTVKNPDLKGVIYNNRSKMTDLGSGIDFNRLDKNIRYQDDFYRHVNG